MKDEIPPSEQQIRVDLDYQMQLTKTITDNTTSALFMMDAKGFPTFMNPAAEKITGYHLEEIKGHERLFG